MWSLHRKEVYGMWWKESSLHSLTLFVHLAADGESYITKTTAAKKERDLWVEAEKPWSFATQLITSQMGNVSSCFPCIRSQQFHSVFLDSFFSLLALCVLSRRRVCAREGARVMDSSAAMMGWCWKPSFALVLLVLSLYVGASLATPVAVPAPSPPPPDSFCNGVYMNYTIDRREKIHPFTDDPAEKPYASAPPP
ncbi:hypothetical protein C4D60_Mb08t09780 [Musa balbisiana]|uniref:Uncharacterized protein n=1 Tax=Musa balbisiana TaxID=52838 RepID=A0A4S8K2M3_MUSBA|nr:hypothetical protein C4D60_Mb08t09780 [Musa balbisiana]